MLTKTAKCLGASFFIAANNMGPYLLIVPLMMGIGGFYPGLVTIGIIWLVTLATGLLYLEAILSLPEGGNFLSLIEAHYGRGFKIFFGIVVLFFFSLITLVVTLQMVLPFFREYLLQWTGYAFSDFSLCLIILLFTSLIAFWGVLPSIIANFLMTLLLLFSLFLFAKSSLPHIESGNLMRLNWAFFPVSIFFLFNVAGFQVIIPTVSTFLKRDRKSLLFSLIFGTFIPYAFLVLLGWSFIGSVPQEDFWILLLGKDETKEGLALLNRFSWLRGGVIVFSIFSALTYILGFLCLTADIIFDGWRVPVERRRGMPRLFIIALLGLSALIVSLWISPTFLTYSERVGDFVDLFLPIIPVLIVWRMRYLLKTAVPHLLPGGKAVMVFLLISLFFLFGFQCVRFIS